MSFTTMGACSLQMMDTEVAQILNQLPARISDVPDRRTREAPDHPALIESSGEWSYAQLAHAVATTKLWLISAGVRPGDRVMIVFENCRTFVAILFALGGLDAWPVLVNAYLSSREIDQIREHCGARLVIYTSSVSPRAAEHARRHAGEVKILPEIGQVAIGAVNIEAICEPVYADGAQQVAALIYTSGTTGKPKGVMLTHKNLLFMAAISARIRRLGPDDRIYGVLPMSHAVGLSVVLLGSLLSGAAVYVTPRFDPIAAPTTLAKEGITVFLGVPAMFGQLLQYAKLRGFKSLDFPALRIISSSGAPLHASIKSPIENLFGLVLHNGYGVTECSPTIAQTRVDEPRSDTSVGKVFPGVEFRLIGREGRLARDEEVGELQVRGPNVMKGYYR
ncbi:MAG: acyl--CoA ligase, partial [Acidobacteria bacterium]|nr:acyl--CoA ligase [Acidobacteriota bacterium]